MTDAKAYTRELMSVDNRLTELVNSQAVNLETIRTHATVTDA